MTRKASPEDCIRECERCRASFTVSKPSRKTRFCGHSCAFIAASRPNMDPARVRAGLQAAADRKRGSGTRPGNYVKRNSRHEHRVVWEEKNGPIPHGCVIHHVDENPRNNALENLQLMSRSDHTRHHTLLSHARKKEQDDGK